MLDVYILTTSQGQCKLGHAPECDAALPPGHDGGAHHVDGTESVLTPVVSSREASLALP